MRRTLASIVAALVLAPLGAVPVMAQSESDAANSVAYGKMLNTRITVDFNQNEFRNVVEFLSGISGVDFLTKWSEDFAGEGLDPEAKITLQLKNPTALVTIVELVLKQASEDETSWCLRDGFVEIGTKEMLNKSKYVRMYPVRELLFIVPTFSNAPELDLESVLGGGQSGEVTGNIFDDQNQQQNQNQTRTRTADPEEAKRADELIDVITSTVDPFQWEDGGGEGGNIRYFRGYLIVNASDYLHRQVAGYPFRPAGVRPASNAQASLVPSPRYVTLSGRFATTRLIDIQNYEVPVLVGGQVIGSGGGGG